MSARIYQLPGAAAEPVVNPKHKGGRWPRCVASLAVAKQTRNYERKHGEAIEWRQKQMQEQSEVENLEILGLEVKALLNAALRLSAQMIRLEGDEQ